MNDRLLSRCLFCALCIFSLHAAWAGDSITDTLVLGVSDSEKAHDFSGPDSETITGGIGESARRLLPRGNHDWQGGTVAFTLKVDPEKQNYVTARFWGDEVTGNRLFLFCDGKQIGYRHLGDIDQLDFGSDEPVYNGRFYYTTSPLPMAMTKGKTVLPFEIRSSGPIWGYGQTFEKYQRAMDAPSRGIYRVYSHTDAFFVPPPDEKQGPPAANAPVRSSPGMEVLDQVKERVNREIAAELGSKKPLSQMQMRLLSRAAQVEWTSAYHNPKVIERVVNGLDTLFLSYRHDPKLAQNDPATPNPEWFGLGPSGEVIQLLSESLQPLLDEQIEDGAGKRLARRDGYTEMLVTCRDWHRKNRRLYSNQTMISDLNGIYLANRGIAVLNPKQALPEAEALHYLYESIGLQPWLGSDTEHGPSKSAGDGYYQLTAKGLTKELGYVGTYGEVLDWVNQIYDASRPARGQPGDERIKAQLIKLAKARGPFRYPTLDAEGNRAMRLETVVGWRDAHLPGDVVYGQRPTWDASALETAAATLDPTAVGYAQQMFADNQFFASVEHAEREKGLRATIGLLSVPDEYEVVKSQTPSAERLPMTWGQPDFVLADEEDGVVAIKHGDEILYASLYWRARFAVNFLARVHYLTPQYSRIAVVHEETELESSGLTYNRPDWTNMGFGGGGLKYLGDIHSAHTGEKLPIARIPEGVKFHPGDESVYAGKGSFYTLRYGPYLIAMNMTTDKSFELKAPAGVQHATDLDSGKAVEFGSPVPVGPRSTLILYLGK